MNNNNKNTYKMYLSLGDPSNDGHGQHDNILLESDVQVERVQQAYIDSCKLTGVSFNNNNDFTGVKRDWKDKEKYLICVEYEEPFVPKAAFNVLVKFGLNEKLIKKFAGYEDYEINLDDDENIVIREQDIFIKLWIWFVKLSAPDISLEFVKDEIPYINGGQGKLAGVQFGYGLY